MDFRSFEDESPQVIDVVPVHLFREGQNFSHKLGDDNFVNRTVRVGRDNGSASEVDTLSR